MSDCELFEIVAVDDEIQFRIDGRSPTGSGIVDKFGRNVDNSDVTHTRSCTKNSVTSAEKSRQIEGVKFLGDSSIDRPVRRVSCRSPKGVANIGRCRPTFPVKTNTSTGRQLFSRRAQVAASLKQLTQRNRCTAASSQGGVDVHIIDDDSQKQTCERLSIVGQHSRRTDVVESLKELVHRNDCSSKANVNVHVIDGDSQKQTCERLSIVGQHSRRTDVVESLKELVHRNNCSSKTNKDIPVQVNQELTWTIKDLTYTREVDLIQLPTVKKGSRSAKVVEGIERPSHRCIKNCSISTSCNKKNRIDLRKNIRKRLPKGSTEKDGIVINLQREPSEQLPIGSNRSHTKTDGTVIVSPDKESVTGDLCTVISSQQEVGSLETVDYWMDDTAAGKRTNIVHHFEESNDKAAVSDNSVMRKEQYQPASMDKIHKLEQQVNFLSHQIQIEKEKKLLEAKSDDVVLQTKSHGEGSEARRSSKKVASVRKSGTGDTKTKMSRKESPSIGRSGTCTKAQRGRQMTRQRSISPMITQRSPSTRNILGTLANNHSGTSPSPTVSNPKRISPKVNKYKPRKSAATLSSRSSTGDFQLENNTPVAIEAGVTEFNVMYSCVVEINNIDSIVSDAQKATPSRGRSISLSRLETRLDSYNVRRTRSLSRETNKPVNTANKVTNKKVNNRNQKGLKVNNMELSSVHAEVAAVSDAVVKTRGGRSRSRLQKLSVDPSPSPPAQNSYKTRLRCRSESGERTSTTQRTKSPLKLSETDSEDDDCSVPASPVFECRLCAFVSTTRFDLNNHYVSFHRCTYNTSVLPSELISESPNDVSPTTQNNVKSILKKSVKFNQSPAFKTSANITKDIEMNTAKDEICNDTVISNDSHVPDQVKISLVSPVHTLKPQAQQSNTILALSSPTNTDNNDSERWMMRFRAEGKMVKSYVTLQEKELINNCQRMKPKLSLPKLVLKRTNNSIFVVDSNKEQSVNEHTTASMTNVVLPMANTLTETETKTVCPQSHHEWETSSYKPLMSANINEASDCDIVQCSGSLLHNAIKQKSLKQTQIVLNKTKSPTKIKETLSKSASPKEISAQVSNANVIQIENNCFVETAESKTKTYQNSKTKLVNADVNNLVSDSCEGKTYKTSDEKKTKKRTRIKSKSNYKETHSVMDSAITETRFTGQEFSEKDGKMLNETQNNISAINHGQRYENSSEAIEEQLKDVKKSVNSKRTVTTCKESEGDDQHNDKPVPKKLSEEKSLKKQLSSKHSSNSNMTKHTKTMEGENERQSSSGRSKKGSVVTNQQKGKSANIPEACDNECTRKDTTETVVLYRETISKTGKVESVIVINSESQKYKKKRKKSKSPTKPDVVDCNLIEKGNSDTQTHSKKGKSLKSDVAGYKLDGQGNSETLTGEKKKNKRKPPITQDEASYQLLKVGNSGSQKYEKNRIGKYGSQQCEKKRKESKSPTKRCDVSCKLDEMGNLVVPDLLKVEEKKRRKQKEKILIDEEQIATTEKVCNAASTTTCLFDSFHHTSNDIISSNGRKLESKSVKECTSSATVNSELGSNKKQIICSSPKYSNLFTKSRDSKATKTIPKIRIKLKNNNIQQHRKNAKSPKTVAQTECMDDNTKIKNHNVESFPTRKLDQKHAENEMVMKKKRGRPKKHIKPDSFKNSDGNRDADNEQLNKIIQESTDNVGYVNTMLLKHTNDSHCDSHSVLMMEYDKQINEDTDSVKCNVTSDSLIQNDGTSTVTVDDQKKCSPKKRKLSQIEDDVTLEGNVPNKMFRKINDCDRHVIGMPENGNTLETENSLNDSQTATADDGTTESESLSLMTDDIDLHSDINDFIGALSLNLENCDNYGYDNMASVGGDTGNLDLLFDKYGHGKCGEKVFETIKEIQGENRVECHCDPVLIKCDMMVSSKSPNKSNIPKKTKELECTFSNCVQTIATNDDKLVECEQTTVSYDNIFFSSELSITGHEDKPFDSEHTTVSHEEMPDLNDATIQSQHLSQFSKKYTNTDNVNKNHMEDVHNLDNSNSTNASELLPNNNVSSCEAKAEMMLTRVPRVKLKRMPHETMTIDGFEFKFNGSNKKPLWKVINSPQNSEKITAKKTTDIIINETHKVNVSTDKNSHPRFEYGKDVNFEIEDLAKNRKSDMSVTVNEQEPYLRIHSNDNKGKKRRHEKHKKAISDASVEITDFEKAILHSSKLKKVKTKKTKQKVSRQVSVESSESISETNKEIIRKSRQKKTETISNQGPLIDQLHAPNSKLAQCIFRKDRRKEHAQVDDLPLIPPISKDSLQPINLNLLDKSKTDNLSNLTTSLPTFGTSGSQNKKPKRLCELLTRSDVDSLNLQGCKSPMQLPKFQKFTGPPVFQFSNSVNNSPLKRLTNPQGASGSAFQLASQFSGESQTSSMNFNSGYKSLAAKASPNVSSVFDNSIMDTPLFGSPSAGPGFDFRMSSTPADDERYQQPSDKVPVHLSTSITEISRLSGDFQGLEDMSGMDLLEETVISEAVGKIYDDHDGMAGSNEAKIIPGQDESQLDIQSAACSMDISYNNFSVTDDAVDWYRKQMPITRTILNVASRPSITSPNGVQLKVNGNIPEPVNSLSSFTSGVSPKTSKHKLGNKNANVIVEPCNQFSDKSMDIDTNLYIDENKLDYDDTSRHSFTSYDDLLALPEQSSDIYIARKLHQHNEFAPEFIEDEAEDNAGDGKENMNSAECISERSNTNEVDNVLDAVSEDVYSGKKYTYTESISLGSYKKGSVCCDATNSIDCVDNVIKAQSNFKSGIDDCANRICGEIIIGNKVDSDIHGFSSTDSNAYNEDSDDNSKEQRSCDKKSNNVSDRTSEVVSTGKLDKLSNADSAISINMGIDINDRTDSDNSNHDIARNAKMGTDRISEMESDSHSVKDSGTVSNSDSDSNSNSGCSCKGNSKQSSNESDYETSDEDGSVTSYVEKTSAVVKNVYNDIEEANSSDDDDDATSNVEKTSVIGAKDNGSYVDDTNDVEKTSVRDAEEDGEANEEDVFTNRDVDEQEEETDDDVLIIYASDDSLLLEPEVIEAPTPPSNCTSISPVTVGVVDMDVDEPEPEDTNSTAPPVTTVTKTENIQDCMRKMENYCNSGDLESARHQFTAIQNEAIDVDRIHSMFHKCLNFGNVRFAFQLLQYLYCHRTLATDTVNKFIYSCSQNSWQDPRMFGDLFQMVKSDNMAPNFDCVIVLLRTFANTSSWSWLWDVMFYCRELDGFVVPAPFVNGALAAMVDSPRQYFDVADKWLRDSYEEQLSQINAEVLQNVSKVFHNRGQLEVATLLQRCATSSGRRTPRPRTPAIPQIDSPDEGPASDGPVETSQDKPMWMNRLNGITFTKQWQILGEMYVERCGIHFPVQSCYVDKFTTVLQSELSTPGEAFQLFIRSVMQTFTAEKRDNEAARLDTRGLVTIGQTLIHNLYEKRYWPQAYAVLSSLTNHALDYLSLQRKMPVRALEVCLQLNQPDSALQVLNGTQTGSLDPTSKDQLVGLLRELFKQLYDMGHLKDCYQVLALSFAHVFTSIPECFICLVNRCLDTSDIQLAIRTYSLYRRHNQTFKVAPEIWRSLLVAAMEANFDEAYDLFTVCLNNQIFPLQMIEKSTREPRRTIVIPVWMTWCEAYLVIGDYLGWLYNTICDQVLTNIPTSRDDLELSVVIKGIANPGLQSKMPYLLSTPSSPMAAEQMVLGVLLNKLVPPLQAMRVSTCHIRVRPESLENYLRHQDMNGRKQGLKFLPVLPNHMAGPGRQNMHLPGRGGHVPGIRRAVRGGRRPIGRHMVRR